MGVRAMEGKIEVPKLSGNIYSKTMMDWIEALESLFNYVETLES